MRDANQQAQNVGTKKTAAQLTIELQEQLRAQSYAQSQTQARLSALAKMQSSVPGAASGAASLSYSNLRDEDRGSAAPARVLEESGSKMKFKSLSGVKHTMETAARHAATAHAKAQFGSLSGGEGESEHMPVDWPMKSKVGDVIWHQGSLNVYQFPPLRSSLPPPLCFHVPSDVPRDRLGL